MKGQYRGNYQANAWAKGSSNESSNAEGKAWHKGGNKAAVAKGDGKTPPVSQQAAKGGSANKLSWQSSTGQLAVKREYGDAPSKYAAPAEVEGPTPDLSVTTQWSSDEIGIQTLVGNYLEKGSNHGRKYFQKVEKISGHEEVQVFLYYWDARDGADFSGWWFGDQLGGAQVWARCPSAAQAPPRVGWCIPWDSKKSEPGQLFVDPFKPEGAVAAPAPVAKANAWSPAAPQPGGKGGKSGKGLKPGGASGTATSPAAWNIKAKALDEQVAAAEARLRELAALETQFGEDANEEAFQQQLEALQGQQEPIVELTRAASQDLTAVRGAGAPCQAAAVAISKLLPRLRQLQANLTGEVNSRKAQAIKYKSQAANRQKEELERKGRAAEEERDAAVFTAELPVLQEMVLFTEDAVESVSIVAQPLMTDPPEGEAVQAAIKEVETLANDAQTKLAEARRELNTKLTNARRFAPDTRKAALKEYGLIQNKLTEAQKLLNPFKKFRQDFQQRLTAAKAIREITEKLSEAELEVEKASMMTKVSDQGQMPEEEVTSCEETVRMAQQCLDAVSRLVQLRSTTADETLKSELDEIKKHIAEAKKKLDSTSTGLRKQRNGLLELKVLQHAHEKADRVEMAWLKCQDAEMPFLKGIEVLPADESARAIRESEGTAQKMETVIKEAKAFISQKLAASKSSSSKDKAETLAKELGELNKRMETMLQNVVTFRKETNNRKLTSLMSVAVEGVSDAENKVEALVASVAIFATSDLESVSAEELRAASEVSSQMEKEASAAIAEARKELAAKLRDGKTKDSSGMLQKLQSRLEASQRKLSAEKARVGSGEKLIKGKQVLQDEGRKITDMEGEVDKIELRAAPVSGPLSVDLIKEVNASVAEVQKGLRLSHRSVELQVPSAPVAMKAALQKLLARGKRVQDRIEAVKTSTKEQREKVLAETCVKEATAKIEEMELAMEKVGEAELPFLKGLEMLPVQLAKDTIAKSEMAAGEVQAAVTAVRTFIAQKNLEVKHFEKALASKSSEALTKLTERIFAATSKLSAFRKDTENRRKISQMQEAGDKIDALEVEVKAAAVAAEPLANKDDSRSQEQQDELSTKLCQHTKAAQSMLEASRTFLAQRQRDVAQNPEQKDVLAKLQKRISEAQVELAKSKKVAGEYEQRFLAKTILAEATETTKTLEAEVEATTLACAPLVEKGGAEFLVSESLQTFAAAIRKHVAEKKMKIDAFFKAQPGGTSLKMTKEAFLTFLEKLPEAIKDETVAFEPERRADLFAMVAGEGGVVTLEKFQAVFRRRFTCIQGITLTDGISVADSKTLQKIEPGTVVVGTGEEKEDGGIVRIECELADGGASGWVTLSGTGGKRYFKAVTAFNEFISGLDKKLDHATKSVMSASKFHKAKTAELQSHSSGPLAEAKLELNTKLRTKVVACTSSVDNLKRKVVAAKRDYLKRAEAEKNAHLEAAERKEAEGIVAAARSKTVEVEDVAKKVEEAAKAMTGLKGAELESFATPIAVVEACESLVKSMDAVIEAARASVTERLEKMNEAIKAKGPAAAPKPTGQTSAKGGAGPVSAGPVGPGPLAEGRGELSKMRTRVDAAHRMARATLQAVKKLCNTIAEARFGETSKAFRNDLMKRGMTLDALFLEFAGKGEETIKESVFCDRLAKLEGITFPPQHARLLFRTLEAGGIGRRRFSGLVQQFFIVTKAIALTSCFDIAECKTIRRIELEELIDVIEGPHSDAKTGLSRVRGRALADGKEGWITIKGNQGTPFLQEVEKPLYAMNTEVMMETDFEGSSTVRMIKPEEVLELLEGPREEKSSDTLRARVKVSGDAATGWFTMKDHHDNSYASQTKEQAVYLCSSSVAITDGLDIKDCKVVTKLAVGEYFVSGEEPVADAGSGIMRLKGVTAKGGQSGWITLKGNAGTVFAAASKKHWVVQREAPLEKQFASGSGIVRAVAKNEVLEVLEGPRKERREPATRFKGRVLGDGAVGWIVVRGKSVRPWAGVYKCSAKLSLNESLNGSPSFGNKVVRELELNEELELLEGPVESQTKEMRGRMRASKDGAIGWATIRTAEGKLTLRS